MLLRSLLILLLAASLGGCLLNRMDHVNRAAQVLCDEADRCDNLGEGGFYSSYDECIVEERSRFNNTWPEDRCGDGKIDPEQFDRCLERVRLAACDGGFGDLLAAADHCRASRVCPD